MSVPELGKSATLTIIAQTKGRDHKYSASGSGQPAQSTGFGTIASLSHDTPVYGLLVCIDNFAQ